MRNGMIVVLCFNDRNGMVFIQIEKIINLLRSLAVSHVTLDVDAPIRDLCLHGDIHTILPSGSVNRRSDVVELDVFFGHLFLIKNHQTILLRTYLKIL